MSKLILEIPAQTVVIASGGPLETTLKRTGTSKHTITNEYNYAIGSALRQVKYELVLEGVEKYEKED